MRLCMFTPRELALERGWPGRIDNDWVVQLYANLGPNKGLELVKELIHPESRRKNGDLVSDRAGNMPAGGSAQPQTFPKEHEAHVFAQELAKTLYHGRAGNAFSRAILCAPPAFMGLLNRCLDGPTVQMVSDRLEKDYTKSSEAELKTRLSDLIFL